MTKLWPFIIACLLIALPWAGPSAANPRAAAPLLIDINPGPAGSAPNAFVMVGGLLYFQADDGAHGSELWRSDGTAAGTWMVKDITTGAAKTRMYSMTTLGNTLFFLRYTDASATAGEVELWRSDGTAAGTALVEKIGDWNVDRGCIYELSAFGSHLSIIIGPGWESDCLSSVAIHTGLTGGTIWRKEGTRSAQTAINGRSYFFFSSQDASAPSGLWASADTAAGIAYVEPLPTTDPIWRSAAGQGIFYFITMQQNQTSGARSFRLWKSTGAAGGTALVTALPQGNYPGEAYVSGQTLFVVLDTEEPLTANEVLWRSDGTAAGTGPLLHLTRSQSNSYTSRFTPLGDRFAFLGPSGCAQEPSDRFYWLWVSDGSAAGTGQVAPAVRLGDHREPGIQFGSPILPVGDQIAFFATDGAHGAEPWISDGTTAGTRMLADLAPGSASSRPAALAALPGQILVSANDGASGQELWVLDPAAPPPIAAAGPYRLYLPQLTHTPTCATP